MTIRVVGFSLVAAIGLFPGQLFAQDIAAHNTSESSPSASDTANATAKSTAVDAEPIPQKLLMEEMSAYTVVLPAVAREALLSKLDEQLDTAGESSPELSAHLQQLRKPLETPDAPVKLMAAMMLLDNDVTPEKAQTLFAGCDDPILRFALNLAAIKSGDRAAADRLHALLRSPKPSSKQKRMLKSYSLAIGIRAADDSPQKVFDFIRTATNHTEPKVKVGDQAPLFQTTTANDQSLKLADLRGKTVLLHFWATWCGPCIGGMPTLKKDLEVLQTTYPSEDLVVVSISLDFDRAAFEKALEEHQPPGANVYDGHGWGGDIARAYGINRLPYEFVIDAKGIVQSHRTEDLEKVMVESLPNKQAPAEEESK